jgi:selenocysteine lyase/cysteine desulfurase
MATTTKEQELIDMIEAALARWQAWTETDDNDWQELHDAFDELRTTYKQACAEY